MKSCNYAELQGSKMVEEMAKQKEKAEKKGLKAPEKKWYWVWYHGTTSLIIRFIQSSYLCYIITYDAKMYNAQIKYS